MASDKLENAATCCFSKIDYRLFMSFFQFALNLCRTLSVIATSLTQPCCKCCTLSLSVVLKVWFTINEMWMKNNTYCMYIWHKRAEREWARCLSSVACFHSALRTCRSNFPVTTKWCRDQDVKVVPSATFTTVLPGHRKRKWPDKPLKRQIAPKKPNKINTRHLENTETHFLKGNLIIFKIYFFMSRHEVHSMNTHPAEPRSTKTDKTERSTRHWSRRNHRVTDTFCNYPWVAHGLFWQ